jgi:hypothetical protein
MTGFIKKDGSLEMHVERIWRRYLRTWFLPDLFLVGIDRLRRTGLRVLVTPGLGSHLVCFVFYGFCGYFVSYESDM